MKTIDFSIPGGFPLTQDRLSDMQDAYSDVMTAFAEMGGSGPTAISGAKLTKALVGGTVYNYVITGGWIYVEGYGIVKIGGSALLGYDITAYNIVVNIYTNPTTLTYYDGSDHDSLTATIAAMIAQPVGTAIEDNQFLVDDMVRIGVELGAAHRNHTGTLAVSTGPLLGNVTGDVHWIVDTMANTLKLRGALTVGDPLSLPDQSVVNSVDLGDLAAGVAPTYRTAIRGFVTRLPGEDTGSARPQRSQASGPFAPYTEAIYLDSVTLYVKDDGHLYADLVNAGGGFYGVEFNAVVPLE